ncbi:unnamed protein product [Boreogadus saida]
MRGLAAASSPSPGLNYTKKCRRRREPPASCPTNDQQQRLTSRECFLHVNHIPVGPLVSGIAPSVLPGDSMLLLTLAQPAWCAPFCTSRAGAASRLGPADSQHASWARPGEAPAEGRGSAPVPRALGLWVSGWARRAQLCREPCCHERVHGDKGGQGIGDGGKGFLPLLGVRTEPSGPETGAEWDWR